MITKAIIPLAGLGRRLGPLASVIPKAMFPLIDHDLRVMPLLQLILAQAHQAGAKQVGLILSAAHTEMLRRYLVAGFFTLLPDAVTFWSGTLIAWPSFPGARRRSAANDEPSGGGNLRRGIAVSRVDSARC